MKIGYAGPPGGFGEEAFEIYKDGRTVEPCELSLSVQGVVEAVANGTVERGLVRAENINRGEFRETYEALFEQSGRVRIVDAFMHSGGYAVGTLIKGREIREIWGTQELLDECTAVLSGDFPGARPVAVPSMARAIQSMQGDRLAGIAIVGSEAGLDDAGLEFIFKDIIPKNMTLYYVLAANGDAVKSEQDVTEIVLTLEKDRPFWLNEVTDVLKAHGRNLTNILRVPDRKGGYWFVLAMMGHINDLEIKECLAGLEDGIPGTKVTVLGCHPRLAFLT